MKKITFMLFASTTIFLASCSTGAEKTETETETTIADTTSVCSDSTVISTETADTTSVK